MFPLMVSFGDGRVPVEKEVFFITNLQTSGRFFNSYLQRKLLKIPMNKT